MTLCHVHPFFCQSIRRSVSLSVHCSSACQSVNNLLLKSALRFVCLPVNIVNGHHIILYVYFSGCLPACLIVCLFACLCMFVRKYPARREPIILAHIPGTNNIFYPWIHLLPRLPAVLPHPDFPRITSQDIDLRLEHTLNLRRMNNIFLCKVKRVPTVNSDKKPQLLTPLKKYDRRCKKSLNLSYQEKMRFQCNLTRGTHC